MKRYFPYSFAAVCLALVLASSGCASSKKSADATAGADTVQTAPPPPPVIPATVPILSAPAQASAAQDTATAGRFDNGRMWTFDMPPMDYLKETYNFSPDAAWFERARLGALRLPNCTASFVSPNGLVMTNHHCGRGSLPGVTREGEKLLEDGFYAESLADERRIPGLFVDQLVRITDVTDEVNAALEGKETDAERAAARQETFSAISNRLVGEAGGRDAGFVVQVISLYYGGRYSAYTFRRYDDLRLVLVPELDLGQFGGDPDNFTYPRYSLDMTFLRVYDKGEPLNTQKDYFRWSQKGVEEGDLVFVIGNPGSTNRLETIAQLEYRRDVQEKYLLDALDATVALLQEEYQQNPSDELLTQIMGLQNGQKLYRGRVKGLNDATLMARRADAERKFFASVEGDASLAGEYGSLQQDLGQLMQERRKLASDVGAFLLLSPMSPNASSTLRRAMLAFQYRTQQKAGAGEATLAPMLEQFKSIENQSRTLDERFLAARLEAFRQYWGAESELVRNALGGRTPQQAAAAIVGASALADSERALAALTGGSLGAGDPAYALAEAFMPRYMALQSANAGLGARQTELLSRLGRARFEVYGAETPPDATFSLRLADGIVKGYEYNGTLAPPYVTFYGLYDRYYSHGAGNPDWDLPKRWLSMPPKFDLETPITLVATADIIGGNSGSPMVNKNLEIVGLVFDGNIESLPSSFIFRDENMRAVAVDARGILESIDDLYEADRIAIELRTGKLIPTEKEADATAVR